MKKNTKIIIAGVVVIALVACTTLFLKNKNSTNIEVNNEIEDTLDEKMTEEEIEEITTFILNGDEKFAVEDYTGALEDYENALNKIENDEELKAGLTQKIEETKASLENAEKETEVFENTKQEETPTEETASSN